MNVSDRLDIECIPTPIIEYYRQYRINPLKGDYFDVYAISYNGEVIGYFSDYYGVEDDIFGFFDASGNYIE